eukprot:scaffold339050_cov51-Prasinocladus_malaysianus.AAC.1
MGGDQVRVSRSEGVLVQHSHESRGSNGVAWPDCLPRLRRSQDVDNVPMPVAVCTPSRETAHPCADTVWRLVARNGPDHEECCKRQDNANAKAWEQFCVVSDCLCPVWHHGAEAWLVNHPPQNAGSLNTGRFLRLNLQLPFRCDD